MTMPVQPYNAFPNQFRRDLIATFVAVGSDLGLFRAATQGLRDKYASA
jgi:hypothetical protein